MSWQPSSKDNPTCEREMWTPFNTTQILASGTATDLANLHPNSVPERRELARAFFLFSFFLFFSPCRFQPIKSFITISVSVLTTTKPGIRPLENGSVSRRSCTLSRSMVVAALQSAIGLVAVAWQEPVSRSVVHKEGTCRSLGCNCACRCRTGQKNEILPAGW